MMATLPGLPMFGHGQVEAFTEKYGMEYKRPRYEENPNQPLVDRHMREIAPLLKNRHVFTESANFALFDFWLDNGTVDENVFAWSNRAGNQSALVVYHNKFANTSGTLHRSSYRTDKNTGALYNVQLHEALALPGGHDAVLAYHDNATSLHYLRRAGEIRERGLRLDLHAYQYHVLQNWREMIPTADYPWDALCSDLNGTGVWSLDDALAKFKLRPVHHALRAALHADTLRCFSDLIEAEAVDAAVRLPSAHQAPCSREETLATLEKNAERFFQAAIESPPPDQAPPVPQPIPRPGTMATARRPCPSPQHSNPKFRSPPSRKPPPNLARTAREHYHHLLTAAEKLPNLEKAFTRSWPSDARLVLPSYSPQTTAVNVLAPVVAWCLVRALVDALPSTQHPGEMFDRLYLRFAIADALQPLGIDADSAYRAAARVHILIAAPQRPLPSATQPLLSWDDPDTVWLTGLHTAQGHRYFNKEAHEQLLWWSALPQLMAAATKDSSAKTSATRITLRALEGQIDEATTAAAQSGYRLDQLLQPSPATAETSSTKSALAKEPSRSEDEPVSIHDHTRQQLILSAPAVVFKIWTNPLQAPGHRLPPTAYRLSSLLSFPLLRHHQPPWRRQQHHRDQPLRLQPQRRLPHHSRMRSGVMHQDQPRWPDLRQIPPHLLLANLQIAVAVEQIDRPLHLHRQARLVPQLNPLRHARLRNLRLRLLKHHRIELAAHDSPEAIALQTLRHPHRAHPKKRASLHDQLRLHRRHQRRQKLQHLHLGGHRVVHAPPLRVRTFRRRPVILRQLRARRPLRLQHHLMFLLQLLLKQSQ